MKPGIDIPRAAARFMQLGANLEMLALPQIAEAVRILLTGRLLAETSAPWPNGQETDT